MYAVKRYSFLTGNRLVLPHLLATLLLPLDHLFGYHLTASSNPIVLHYFPYKLKPCRWNGLNHTSLCFKNVLVVSCCSMDSVWMQCVSNLTGVSSFRRFLLPLRAEAWNELVLFPCLPLWISTRCDLSSDSGCPLDRLWAFLHRKNNSFRKLTILWPTSLLSFALFVSPFILWLHGWFHFTYSRYGLFCF